MEERNKVTKFTIAIVFISFLLSTAVSLISLHLMASQNQQELNRVLAAQIFDTISMELGEPAVVSRTMANDRFLMDALEKEKDLTQTEAIDIMKEYLLGIEEGLGYKAAFVISDQTKRYYTYNGLNKVIDPENDEYDRWYTEFLSTGKPYSFVVNNDELNHNAWTVFVNARIVDSQNNLMGVCGVGFEMVSSRMLFEQLEAQHRVKISRIDRNHIIQVDTDESRIAQTFNQSLDLADVGPNEYVFQWIGRAQSAVTKYLDTLDWYLVVQSTQANTTGPFVSVILINLLLFAAVMAILLFASRIIISRTKDLTEASFTDQSTGLLNRRAFEEKKAILANQPLKSDFVYIIADVNGLKTANDTLGHSAGDELIAGAADCLRKHFGPLGKIYRIGGDEFAIMLNADRETLDRTLREFHETVSGWQGHEVKELAISTGSAAAHEFPSETITELSRIADERMYEAKEAYYVNSGKDRRRR